MATLYAGVIGAWLQSPWNLIAKTQWLFKATELGFYPSVNPIVTDRNVIQISGEFGKKLLYFRHPAFESPPIEYPNLVTQFNMFAAMPGPPALRILRCLGEVPSKESSISMEEKEAEDARRDTLRRDLPNLFHFERFSLNRIFDVGPTVSDASNLYILTKASNLERCAYSDALEGFVGAAWEK